MWRTDRAGNELKSDRRLAGAIGSFRRMWHAEFNDPALVMVYDAAFGWSHADDFFICVVNETRRRG